MRHSYVVGFLAATMVGDRARIVDGFPTIATTTSSSSSSTAASRSTKTRLWYDHGPPASPDEEPAPRVPGLEPPRPLLAMDVSCLALLEAPLGEWLSGLAGAECSDPAWIAAGRSTMTTTTTTTRTTTTQGDVLTIGPLALIQELLGSLVGFGGGGGSAPFPEVSEWERTRFDFGWRESLLKGLPSGDLREVLQEGQSHTHPLRLELVAIPPRASLPLRVSPAAELAVVLLGELSERTSAKRVPRDLLCRQPHHCLGTPLGTFSHPPTPNELATIRDDLASRLEKAGYSSNSNSKLPRLDDEEPRVLRPGDCRVHEVGTVHRSSTGESPCLLLVLGPGVHAEPT